MSKQFSTSKRISVHAKTDGFCAYCGTKVGIDDFVIDHLHPKALGGRNNIENLMPACWSCNSSKGSKTIEQFRLFSAVKKVTGDTIFGQAQVEYLHQKGAFKALGFDDDHKFHFEVFGGVE